MLYTPCFELKIVECLKCGLQKFLFLATHSFAKPYKREVHNAILFADVDKLESLLEKYTEKLQRKKSISLQSQDYTHLDFEIARRQNPLHVAVLMTPFNLDIFNLLLRYASPQVLNGQDEYGDTPLHKAIFIKNDEAIQSLIHSETIHLDCKDNNWQTPAHYAILTNNQYLLKRLFELNIDGLDKDLDKRQTLLHYAVLYRRHSILEYLLKLTYENCNEDAYKMYINASDYKNMNPLHYAVKNNDLKSVNLILTHRKGHINLEAKSGFVIKSTAAEIAKHEGHFEILQLLKKHGAKAEFTSKMQTRKPATDLNEFGSRLDIDWDRINPASFMTPSEHVENVWKKFEHAGKNTIQKGRTCLKTTGEIVACIPFVGCWICYTCLTHLPESDGIKRYNYIY